MNIRIGTCGYSYQEWRGAFYPEKMPPGKFLEFYAEHFDAVEVNATYYRIPMMKALEGMVRRTPDSFTFVVKAHQDMTHNRGERGEATLPLFREALKPFQNAGKLGAVLLQFPYSFRAAPESVRYIETLADRLANAPLVVEFRHRDWFSPAFLKRLKERSLSLCCVDEPALPNLPPPVAEVTGPIGYVRFHGRNKKAWWGAKDRPAGERYDYLYTKDELEEWVPKVKKMSGTSKDLFAFFNNHPQGKAVRNAGEFRGMMAA